MKITNADAFSSNGRVNIEGVILKSLALAGVLTIAVLAPNALQLLTYIDKNKKRKKKPEYLIDSTLKRLASKGLIGFSKGKVRLTRKGEQKLHIIEYGVFPLPKTRWDGKWRIVSFDINEKRKTSREKLRFLLHQVGFVRLQDSVWVYPYDVEEVIDLIKTANFLNKEVLYITAHTTGNDRVLETHFKLS